MSRLAVKVGPLASSGATKIALSQAVGGAGNLTLNGALVSGGVATLDTPRRVTITSLTGDNSGVTFTVYGTDFAGYPLQASTLGAVSSGSPVAIDVGVSFLTVTKITASGASTGNVEAGTNGVADSAPLFLDEFGFAPTSLQVNVSGTANFTVAQTLDDPTNPNWIWSAGGTAASFSNVVWINHPDTNLVANTVSVQGNYAYVPKMVRVTLNSESGSGYVVLQVIQAASPSIG